MENSCETPESNSSHLINIPESRIITVTGISKTYSTEPFSGLQSVSFTVNKGEIIAIVGESGSGKSTLLKLIYGLIGPEEGFVYFKHEEVRGPAKKLIPGHDSMKMVTQDFSLNTYAKVYDNIASMLPNTNLKFKAKKTEEMLDLLRITHLAQKRVADLSGGEQQRVAIAKAIITEPEVLLLDEPFSQVDTMLKSQLRVDIKRLSHELGITVIMVSHDPVDGLSLADKLVVLRRGAMIETGTPHELYNQPQNFYTAKLLADCNVLDKESAEKIGISSSHQTIAIHTEDLLLREGSDSNHYRLLDCSFKGYCEELLLEKEGVKLRALNFEAGKFKVGDLVPLRIKRYLEFN